MKPIQIALAVVIALVFVKCLTGCGGTPLANDCPGYRLGIELADSGYSCVEAGAIVNKALAWHAPDQRPTEPWTVRFQKEVRDPASPQIQLFGSAAEKGDRLIIIEAAPLSQCQLVHELFHAWLRDTTGDGQGTHPAASWGGPGGYYALIQTACDNWALPTPVDPGGTSCDARNPCF